MLDAVRYELEALAPAAPARPGTPPALDLGADAGEEVFARARDWRQATERFEALCRDRLGPGAGEALGRARAYLDLGDRPLVEPLRLPAGDRLAPPARPGWSAEVAAADLASLAWEGVEEYVASRLGPLTTLLDGLGARDQLVFSSRPAMETLATLRDVQGAARLHLPLASYGKEVVLAEHADGRRTLLLASLPGRVYLRHLQLQVRHHLRARGHPPRVLVLEDPEAFGEAHRRSAADLLRALGDPAGLEALVVGYAERFRTAWARARVDAGPPPPPREGLPGPGWSAEAYELVPGRRVVVLSCQAPFHGEILGEVLRLAAEGLPDLRAVFFAGSGGSLLVRAPYSLVVPDVLELPGGGRRVNALSSLTTRVAHRSVLSPMVETPRYLERAQRDQVTTLDMEAGWVAEALRGLPVALGVVILVTDFPVTRPSLPSVALSRSDAGRKYAQLDELPGMVERWLVRGRPVLGHALERHLDLPLRSLSYRNLARELVALGPMTPAEQQIFSKVARLPFRYSFRLTPWRLLRILEDRAILSTAQVASLKGVEVKPFTPRVEEDLYGAYGYTFGSLGFWTGDEAYGSVVLRVRPATWRRRSWASRNSGWWAIQRARQEAGLRGDHDHLEPEVVEPARWLLAGRSFLPGDYGRAIALRVVDALRDHPEWEAPLLAARGEELVERLLEYQLGYLEGKVLGSMSLADLELVTLPTDLEPALRERLLALAKEAGVPVEVAPAPGTLSAAASEP